MIVAAARRSAEGQATSKVDQPGTRTRSNSDSRPGSDPKGLVHLLLAYKLIELGGADPDVAGRLLPAETSPGDGFHPNWRRVVWALATVLQHRLGPSPCCKIATALLLVVWTTATDPSRSSFEPEAERITRDPASIMLALSHTVIFDHRESTAVLLSSIMFFMGAFTLIELVG